MSLETWRIMIASLSVFTLGTMTSSIYLFLRARRRGLKVASISPMAAVVGMIGAFVSLGSSAVYRIQAILLNAPLTSRDLISVPLCLIWLTSSLLLIHDLGRILGNDDATPGSS